MLSLNCKHVQHVKIYLPCNFEVNPINVLIKIRKYIYDFRDGLDDPLDDSGMITQQLEQVSLY